MFSGSSVLTGTFSSYLFWTSSGKWGCWWGFQQQEDIQKGNKNINENTRKPRRKNKKKSFVVFEKASSIFCKISSQVTDPLSRKQTLPLISTLEGSIFGVAFICDSVKLNLGGIVFLEIEGIKRTQRRIIMLTLPNPELRVGSRSSDWLGCQARPRIFGCSGLVPRCSKEKAVWMAGTGRAGGAWSCYFREVGWGRSSETLWGTVLQPLCSHPLLESCDESPSSLLQIKLKLQSFLVGQVFSPLISFVACLWLLSSLSASLFWGCEVLNCFPQHVLHVKCGQKPRGRERDLRLFAVSWVIAVPCKRWACTQQCWVALGKPQRNYGVLLSGDKAVLQGAMCKRRSYFYFLSFLSNNKANYQHFSVLIL